MHRVLGILLAGVLIYSGIQGNRKGLRRCRALRVRTAGWLRPPTKTLGLKVSADPEQRQRLVQRMALSTPDNVLVAIPAAVSGARDKGEQVPACARTGSANSWGVGELQLWGRVGQVGQSFGGTSWSVRFIPTRTIPGFYGTGDLGG